MAIEDTPCPMCGLPVLVHTPQPNLEGNMARVDPGYKTLTCKRCGEYRVSRALGWLPKVPQELRSYLSAATRQGYEAGAPILLDSNNLDDLAARHRSVTVSQKVEKALRFVATRCGRPGAVAQIDFDMDCPVADCSTKNELEEYVDFLSNERALLKAWRTTAGLKYAPTIAGWQAVEPTLPTEGEPDRCFVAMWFNDAMDSVYESGFAPAIVECGFKAYRVKEDSTNKGIADRVLAEIRRARFVIADFTGQRTSVYYEAGFAHGLGAR